MLRPVPPPPALASELWDGTKMSQEEPVRKQPSNDIQAHCVFCTFRELMGSTHRLKYTHAGSGEGEKENIKHPG